MAKFTVFDVETPNRFNDRICSIGITIIENGTITESKSYLINPECGFDNTNIKIHGIDQNAVLDSPTFDVVWKDIGESFRDNILVAHNATFDISVLNKTLDAYGIHENPFNYICTLQISRDAFPNLPHHGLADMCKYYDIELKHHNAESDSYACANLVCKMIADNIIGSEDLTVLKSSCINESKNRNASKHPDAWELQSIKINIERGFLKSDFAIWSLEFMNSLYDKSPCALDIPECKEMYNTISGIINKDFIEQQDKDCLINVSNAAIKGIDNFLYNKECLNVCNKRVCLSGGFVNGSKDIIETILINNGAVIKSSISKQVDILLIGGLGSENYKDRVRGTKELKALELQEKGHNIEIIHEDDFFIME